MHNVKYSNNKDNYSSNISNIKSFVSNLKSPEELSSPTYLFRPDAYDPNSSARMANYSNKSKMTMQQLLVQSHLSQQSKNKKSYSDIYDNNYKNTKNYSNNPYDDLKDFEKMETLVESDYDSQIKMSIPKKSSRPAYNNYMPIKNTENKENFNQVVKLNSKNTIPKNNGQTGKSNSSATLTLSNPSNNNYSNVNIVKDSKNVKFDTDLKSNRLLESFEFSKTTKTNTLNTKNLKSKSKDEYNEIVPKAKRDHIDNLVRNYFYAKDTYKELKDTNRKEIEQSINDLSQMVKSTDLSQDRKEDMVNKILNSDLSSSSFNIKSNYNSNTTSKSLNVSNSFTNTKNKKLTSSDLYNSKSNYGTKNSKKSMVNKIQNKTEVEGKSELYADIYDKFDKINEEINTFNLKMKDLSSEKQKIVNFIKTKKDNPTNKLLSYNNSKQSSRNRVETEDVMSDEKPKQETAFSKKLKEKLQELKLKTPKAMINQSNANKTKMYVKSSINSSISNSITNSRNTSKESIKSVGIANKIYNKKYIINKSNNPSSRTSKNQTPNSKSANLSSANSVTSIAKNAWDKKKQDQQVNNALDIRTAIKKKDSERNLSRERSHDKSSTGTLSVNISSIDKTPMSKNRTMETFNMKSSNSKASNFENSALVKKRVQESMRKYVDRVSKVKAESSAKPKERKFKLDETTTSDMKMGKTIMDRAAAWLQARKEKVDFLKTQQIEELSGHCTFQPKLRQNSSNNSSRENSARKSNRKTSDSGSSGKKNKNKSVKDMVNLQKSFNNSYEFNYSIAKKNPNAKPNNSILLDRIRSKEFFEENDIVNDHCTSNENISNRDTYRLLIEPTDRESIRPNLKLMSSFNTKDTIKKDNNNDIYRMIKDDLDSRLKRNYF